MLLGPRHSLRIVSVRRYVAEPGAAVHSGAARRAVQERRGLSAGAGGVRAEQAIARAAGDAVFNGPRHRLGVVAACGNVRKADRTLRLGRTGRTPQEGDDLGPGAVQVGTKRGLRRALGDLTLEHPLHRVHVVGAVCHVRKGIHPGEGRLHRHLIGGHLKGVGAVAVVLDGQLLALGIPDDHLVHLVMALRLHGDGHLVALGRAGLEEGNGAVRVLAHLRLNGVGGGSGAAATAGGAGADGQLTVLIADGVVVGSRRAAGKDLNLAGLGHVGGNFAAVRADVLHRRLGRQFLLAHQTGNGAAVRPQRGGLVAHIGGLILGLDGDDRLADDKRISLICGRSVRPLGIGGVLQGHCGGIARLVGVGLLVAGDGVSAILRQSVGLLRAVIGEDRGIRRGNGDRLLLHRQGAGRRRLVIILRGGRLGGDDRRARALDGDLAGAVHGGNRRLTALVGHGAALNLTGSGEGKVLVTVGLGHAAVLKLEAVLNQLIRGMEGQRGGDVLVVRGGNGDAAALLRCSRDVLRAEVAEFAATHAHGA